MSKALRIPGPGRTRRPGLALAVLTVASVAVLVAAEIWLHTGWTGIGLTLRSQLCNGTPLEGFTLSGSLGWTVTQNRIHFTLQDGVLHTELRLDDPDAVHDIPGVVPTRSYALSPETRDQADANAVVNRPGIEGNRQANTTVNTVRRMYTIWLPDDTELRVDAGDVSLSEGVTLTATEENPLDDFSYNDYTLQVLSGSDDASWPDLPVNTQSFVLGAGKGLCWTQNLAGRAPGLYRVQGLTRYQIGQLPTDGTVQGYPVVCNSTEYGTLTPFYCPADAQQALAGASMADGSTLLLYLNGENVLCADLVNAAGNRTDHRELTTLEKAARIIAARRDFPVLKTGALDAVKSGLVNAAFYRFQVKAKAFTVSDACIACGKCVALCPLGNVRLQGGRPVWSDHCTHCMACICGCPAKAIEYGRISRGKPRYQCPPYEE